MPSATFNSSSSWEAPTGVTSVTVECWGAGGGGANGSGGVGGGGGGGGYSTDTVSVTPGNNYTVTVGTGGAGGDGGSGSAGGTSTFESVSAGGGGGGTFLAGGSGGTGDFSGGDGGDPGSERGGGGGGAAGSGGNGNAGADGDSGGAGGAGVGGGGDGGDGDTVNNPQAGSAPGGGSGGSELGDPASGAAGRVTLTWDEPEPDPLEIITLTLDDGTENIAYSETITAQNGTSPYSWSVVSGSVPTGLTLASSGTPSTTLSGTPTTAGTYNFTVRVTDNVSDTDDQAYSVTIDEEDAGPIITQPFLINGTVDEAYNESISATGGTSPYSWSVVSGSLPPGLSLTGGTGLTTSITGTPTTVGSYPFTVRITDDNALWDEESYTIDISAAGTPKLRRIWGGLTVNPLLQSSRVRV